MFHVTRDNDQDVENPEKPLITTTRTTYIVTEPAPLGLMGFVLTTFILSCYNTGLIIPNSASHTIMIGLAAGYGGLAQLLSGILELSDGNILGAMAFCTYGTFWISFAVIQCPWIGVRSAFAVSSAMLNYNQTSGLWMLGWTIFTFMMWFATLRTSTSFMTLFFSLSTTFLLLTVGEITFDQDLVKAGCISGIITAVIAWYLALAHIVEEIAEGLTEVRAQTELEDVLIRL